jgi:hypothetical protein
MKKEGILTFGVNHKTSFEEKSCNGIRHTIYREEDETERAIKT